MKVAILGSGPAGLMSAAAILSVERDAQITILASGGKSDLYGAQYLHQPIPGYTDEDEYISVKYEMWGPVDGYRRKVYGSMWDGTVSPEDLEEHHNAWDIRETYQRLWEDYAGCIYRVHVDHAGLRALTTGRSIYGYQDIIISSIPKPALCVEGHQFKGTEIWAAGDAPDLGIRIPHKQCQPGHVLCNGKPVPYWYRLSNIFDHKTVEYPAEQLDVKPPLPFAAKVIKPLSNNCDCFPDVIHVGRYGKWEKGVLSHTAYGDVRSYFETRT